MEQNTSPNHNNGMNMDIGIGIGIGIDSEDLLYEIFLRLPSISLFRFKYVSKSWYSLISNLEFLLHYSNNSKNNKVKQCIDLLLLGPSRNPVDIIDSALSIFRLNICLPKSNTNNKDEQHLVLNNSCNGLLLYHQYSTRDYNVSSNNNTTVFYVCNPITKDYIKIPNIELKNAVEQDVYKKVMKDTRIACIVFDPSLSLSYKVIRVCLSTGTRRRSYCYSHEHNCLCGYIVLYVYSSETRSWKLLTSFDGGFDFGFRSALVNGVFYWYTDTRDDCLCFDVEKEKVWFLPLPTKPILKQRYYSSSRKCKRICLYFGECSGRVCLIEKYHDINPTDSISMFPYSFDIMEMEQQKQEDERQYIWRVKYHVNMDPGFHHHIKKLQSHGTFEVRIMHHYRATTGTKKEEAEEALLMNIDGTDMVVSFNLTSNTFADKVIVIPNIKHTSKLRGVLPYTPTLCPVHL